MPSDHSFGLFAALSLFFFLRTIFLACEDRCVSMCVSMKMFPSGGARSPYRVYVCRSRPLALPDPRKGMEDARRPSEAPFPSSITPSVAHPLNVANEAAVTRSERGRKSRRRPRRGRKSRRELIRAWRTLGARRRRGRSNNSALDFLRRIFFRARKIVKREDHERINGNWCYVDVYNLDL